MSEILPWNIPFRFPSEERLNSLTSIEVAAAASVLAFLMNESYSNIEPTFSFSSDEIFSLETEDEA